MKKTSGKKEVLEINVKEEQADRLPKCSFSWKKLIEMKDKNVEFFAGDGRQRLRIFDIDGKTKSLYMVSELGKITWPLRFEKLEKIHKTLHSGKVALLPYEIDKLVPTWGNFVTGLFRYLGCDKAEQNLTDLGSFWGVQTEKSRKRSEQPMIVYVVFCKDYRHRKGELMGMLVERRKDMRGQTRLESGTRWAWQAFGHLVKDKRDIFVFPKEMEIDDDKGWLVEKGIFSKEEFLEVEKRIDQVIKKTGR